MTWEPITLDELQQLIAAGEAKMDSSLRQIWEKVRIAPVKWQLHPWGDEGGGFWVVAIIDDFALWYNDIEDGFNISQFTVSGTIDDYWCNQDELQHAVYRVWQKSNPSV